MATPASRWDLIVRRRSGGWISSGWGIEWSGSVGATAAAAAATARDRGGKKRGRGSSFVRCKSDEMVSSSIILPTAAATATQNGDAGMIQNGDKKVLGKEEKAAAFSNAAIICLDNYGPRRERDTGPPRRLEDKHLSLLHNHILTRPLGFGPDRIQRSLLIHVTTPGNNLVMFPMSVTLSSWPSLQYILTTNPRLRGWPRRSRRKRHKARPRPQDYASPGRGVVRWLDEITEQCLQKARQENNKNRIGTANGVVGRRKSGLSKTIVNPKDSTISKLSKETKTVKKRRLKKHVQLRAGAESNVEKTSGEDYYREITSLNEDQRFCSQATPSAVRAELFLTVVLGALAVERQQKLCAAARWLKRLPNNRRFASPLGFQVKVSQTSGSRIRGVHLGVRIFDIVEPILVKADKDRCECVTIKR
ncbi:hypothetical protein BU23DRAFT_575611 [Bimuria novae-zelandiae CBS 107.79]|uniref:Uncharacterized protein n=1 Tax=Bimuria novae-zelandiae CBS 107.79 TaxID=1447943 RepID=A0A6A5UID5_9PLEO|nr:hypothetical protein BU23DRAFT_575611 [Bimuria novae-zelandiae CBS 107.79]